MSQKMLFLAYFLGYLLVIFGWLYWWFELSPV
jgi:hypothetical protein